jgi:hypothetical protein
MTRRWIGIGGAAAGIVAIGIAVGVAVASTSCSQTPTNVPVRSLQDSQNVDFVCLNSIQESDGGLVVPPLPQVQEQCAPVPANVVGSSLPNHLFAVVTQSARGELAVVDLTAGVVVDEDRSTPGINFIPVGTSPTDVATTPDGMMTFVTSASETKPAIYGIPNGRLLGDYGGTPPLRLTDLQGCLLPQAPQSIKVATTPAGGTVLLVMLRSSGPLGQPPAIVAVDPAPITGVDAGAAAERGPDAGPAGSPGTLDPCQVLGGTGFSNALPAAWSPGPAWADGVPYADAGAATEPSPLEVCGAAGFPDAGAGGPGQPTDAGEGGTAADAGDGGISLSFGTLEGPHPTAMVLRDDLHVLYVADESAPLIHVFDVSDPTSPREQAPLLATSVLDPSRRVVVGPLALSPATRDFKRYLYAVDTRDDSVMVYDVTDPVAGPHVPLHRPHPELNPFVEPDRIVFAAPIAALTFVQHDWPLPSQSPAEMQMPVHQYTGLLCNPNPNAHPDAGAFLDLGAFYRVDLASLIQPSGARENFPLRLRGVFAFVTLSNGNVTVIDVDDWDSPCRRPDPMAAGQVKDLASPPVVYDAGGGQTGLLALPQPEPGSTPDAGQFDPYHTPLAYNSAISESAAVTLEPFFPVSAPHRLRSTYLLMNDPVSGVHMPYLTGTPGLFDVNGAPQPTSGTDALTRPQMLPTMLPPNWLDYSYLVNSTEPNPDLRTYVSDFAAGSCGYPASLQPPGSTGPGVRMSFDDPTPHADDDWAVTYEGVLPTVSGVVADMVLDDGGQKMTLFASGARLCGRGIEDWNQGQTRVAQLQKDLAVAGLPPPPADRAQWTSDYVEITDDLLYPNDTYWALDSTSGSADGGAAPVCSEDGGVSESGAGDGGATTLVPINDCWDGDLAGPGTPERATARYNACYSTFSGSAGGVNTWTPDQYLARDFPILTADDDKLVVGRFGWDDTNPAMPKAPVTEATTNRVVVGPSCTNAPFLRFAQCCFHHQIGFKVRAGGEWVAVGTNRVGFLQHVRADDSTPDRQCVQSPDPRLALLNARALDIPWSTLPTMPNGTCTPPAAGLPRPFFRDSSLAMRNPLFSFVMWSGCGPLPGYKDHTLSQRDDVWRFSIRGGFTPITIPLVQGSTTAVSPQSMRFIPSLGQIAVIDGEAQGLVLIDLYTVAFAHAYF